MIRQEQNEDNRRIKNLLINKGLQFKFIMTSLLYMFLVLIVTIAIMVAPDLYTMFMSDNLEVQSQAARNFLVLATRITPAIFFLFILIFIHQLFMTHKIFGPLVNFSTTFKKIGMGDFSRKIRLRKGDYLKMESEVINSMIEGLSQRFNGVADSYLNDIETLEGVLAGMSDGPARENLENLVENMKKRVSEMSDSLVFENSNDEQ